MNRNEFKLVCDIKVSIDFPHFAWLHLFDIIFNVTMIVSVVFRLVSYYIQDYRKTKLTISRRLHNEFENILVM